MTRLLAEVFFLPWTLVSLAVDALPDYLDNDVVRRLVAA